MSVFVTSPSNLSALMGRLLSVVTDRWDGVCWGDAANRHIRRTGVCTDKLGRFLRQVYDYTHINRKM